MKIRAKAGKDKIHFTSPIAERSFFEKYAGKELNIEIDDRPTTEMRRYFEGCLVPVIFYTHPHSGWRDFKDAREAVKGEFLPTKTIESVRTKTKISIVPSTNDLGKRAFRQFIDAIVYWLLENQLCSESDIDSEAYKAWRDRAPEKGAEYPPLARLKARYNELHGEDGKKLLPRPSVEEW